MADETLADAAVRIVADFDTFEPELRRKLNQAVRAAANDAERQFQRSGNRSGRAFADAVNQGAGRVQSLDRMRAQIERLEAAAVSAGDAQRDAAGRVRVAEAALQQLRDRGVTDLGRLAAAEERLAAAQRNSARVSSQLQRATEALTRGREAAFRQAGEQAGEQAGDGFGNGFTRAARRAAGDGGDEAGGFFARAFESAAARNIGTGLFTAFTAGAASLVTAASPLSTVLGGATAAVVALAASLAQASGAAIALGPVLGALGTAGGSLAVGFSGVGDAIKAQTKALEELRAEGEVSAATQEKLDAALKNLAPAAAAVVTQLGAMAPAWEAVRRNVQQTLFAGVSTAIANLGNRYLPILNSALASSAGALNATALSLARFLNTSTTANQISRIFAGLEPILSNLLSAVVPLAGAFLNIFEASLPFAQRLAVVIEGLGLRFAEFLNQAIDSGSFAQFMEDAFRAADALFGVLGNLGSIIGSVFGAGQAEGTSLLELIERLTGQVAAFLNSADGQAALADFFGLIGEAGNVLISVFNALRPALSGVGDLFAALQGPIGDLGRALAPVITALSEQLGAALRSLSVPISELVRALTPLAVALGELAVTQLTAIIPAVRALLDGIVPLAAALVTGLVPAFASFAQIAPVLAPILAQLAIALTQGLLLAVQQIVPILPQLVDALVQLVVATVQLLPALIPLIPPLAQLSVSFLQLLLTLTPLVLAIIQNSVAFANSMGPALTLIVGLIQPVITGFIQFINILTQVVGAILGFVATAIGQFNIFDSGTRGAITRLVSGVVGAISGMVSSVTGFFRDMVANVAGVLGGWITSARDQAGRVASGIIDAIRGGLSGLAGVFRAPFDAARDAVSGAIEGIVDVVAGAVGRIQDLVSRISGAISRVSGFNFPGIDVPGFANGGLVPRPTFATLAEQGPEVVIPLNKPKRRDELLEKYFGGWGDTKAWSGGGGYGGSSKSVTVQVPIHAGTVVDPEQLAGMVGDELDRRFGRTIGIETAGGNR